MQNSYQGYQHWQGEQPTAVCLGVFDSVHLGHQALIQATKALAKQHSCLALAYTFTPHPAALLSPTLAPSMLEPLAIRCQRLRLAGLDNVIVEPFTADFANLSAHTFVEQILVHKLRIKAVVVGHGFTFGKGQGGNVALLEQLGTKYGFTVQAVAPVREQGMVISSTKIREFVGAGQMAGAAVLLGRNYGYFGVVEQGQQRGRTIGFPTANLNGGACKLPEHGVYVAWAHVLQQVVPAIVNVGSAPTFVANQPGKVEVHLLQSPSKSLYGLPIAISFVQQLRHEHRFADREALVAQIKRDIEQAQHIHQQLPERASCWPSGLSLPDLTEPFASKA